MSAASLFPHQSTWRRLAVLPFLLIGAGCALDKSPSVASGDAISVRPPPVAATPNLSPDARLDLAMDLLQKGDAERAKAELKACLDQAPDSRAAKLLLAEMETPLAKLFPKQNFSVTLGRSETLSALASTYLGDPLAFYGLARYNDIAQPGMIFAGEQIRIPATPEALAAQNGFMRAQQMTADEAPQAQPETPKSGADQARPKGTRPASSVSSARHDPADAWAQFKSAASQARYSNAARLADANNFDPGEGHAVALADTYMRAAAAEKKAGATLAAADARKAGTLFLAVLKQPGKARQAFQLTLSLDPSDNVARVGLKKAQGWIAEEYYRRGMIAFRHQDLDGAIAAWNVVLSIDPNYRDAQLNRDEAIQLKANLLKLKG